MKRFDLVIGKNDGYAYARCEERSNGDYVRCDDAQAEITRLRGMLENLVTDVKAGGEDWEIRMNESYLLAKDEVGSDD